MRIITILITFLLSASAMGYEEIRVEVSDQLKQSVKSLTQKKIDPDLIKAAEEAQQTARQNAKQWDISRILLKEENANGKNEEKTDLPQKREGQLYVFISKSVPLKTLQTYAKFIDRIDYGVMVMNGFVGDPKKIKPTMKLISDVLKKDSFCEISNCEKYRAEVQINPILFRKYGIDRVPAFVWVNQAKDSFCDDDLMPLAEHEVLVLEGDADLLYVLQEMQRLTESNEIQQIIEEYQMP